MVQSVPKMNTEGLKLPQSKMMDRFNSSRFSDSRSMYGMYWAGSPLRNHSSMSQSRDDTDFYLEK